MDTRVAGHIIPGVCFIGFGLFFLILTTKRLFRAESNEAFCNAYIPERNLTMMRGFSLAVIICSLFGFFLEGMGNQLLEKPGNHSFDMRNTKHFMLSTVSLVLLDSLNQNCGYL